MIPYSVFPSVPNYDLLVIKIKNINTDLNSKSKNAILPIFEEGLSDNLYLVFGCELMHFHAFLCIFMHFHTLLYNSKSIKMAFIGAPIP